LFFVQLDGGGLLSVAALRPAGLRLAGTGGFGAEHLGGAGFAEIIIRADLALGGVINLVTDIVGRGLFDLIHGVREAENPALLVDFDALSGDNVIFSEEPPGFDAEVSRFMGMVRPEAAQSADRVSISINNFMIDVLLQISHCFIFHSSIPDEGI
jgi:hypothetical protein